MLALLEMYYKILMTCGQKCPTIAVNHTIFEVFQPRQGWKQAPSQEAVTLVEGGDIDGVRKCSGSGYILKIELTS